MKLKKILALTTALAMSLSMATTAFATGTSGTGTGTGALEGTVDTDVFEVVVPSSATLNFFADPEGLIDATEGARYEGADFEEGASLFFDNSTPATVEVTVITDENEEGEAMQLPLYAEEEDAEILYVLYNEEYYAYDSEAPELVLTTEDGVAPEEDIENPVAVMDLYYASTSVDVTIKNKSSVEVNVSVVGAVAAAEGITLAETADGIDEAVAATMYLALVYGEDDTVQALSATEASVTETLAEVPEENWTYNYDDEDGYQYVRDPEFDEFPEFTFHLTGASGGDWSELVGAAPEVQLTWSVEVKPSTFTVTFDLNGEDAEPISPLPVEPNGTVSAPKAPVVDGMTFDGWYTEAECKNEFDFETEITADITLYAKWTEVPAGPVAPVIADVEITDAASTAVATVEFAGDAVAIGTVKYKLEGDDSFSNLTSTYRTISGNTLTLKGTHITSKVRTAGSCTYEVTFKDAEGATVVDEEGNAITATFTVTVVPAEVEEP